jgi:predicted ATPase
MKRAFDITGDDLDAWSQSVDAADALPTLVRRLLLATTPLGAIEMRGDGGTRLGGWDGLVSAHSGTEFCPRGRSVWELSVRKDIEKKFNEDFSQRSQRPADVVPAATCYMAVTARRFAGKQSWASEKNQLRAWAEVRALDADDLATWLEQAPAVGRWFAAEHLNRPALDLQDITSALQAWEQRTRPPLPSTVLLAGRNKEAEDVRAWLQAPDASPLLIKGATKEEALLFVAAIIAQDPSPITRESLLARSLVVESQEALRWATRLSNQKTPVKREPLIVLPLFDKFRAADAYGDAKVVVPLDPSEPDRDDVLRLRRLSRVALVSSLTDAKLPAHEAERFASQSGGQIAALQRLMGYVELPDWARDRPRAALYAMLLAGKWVPSLSADGEIMHQLGSNVKDVDALCTDLTNRSDPAIGRYGEFFAWRSPADAWQALARGLTRDDLRRFQEVVKRVLDVEEPGLGLPPEERFVVAMQSTRPSYSEPLRQGLAESIAYLSLRSDDLKATFGAPPGRRLAANFVGGLLKPSWKAWASLRHVVSALAEADPLTFLGALETLLSQDTSGVKALLNGDHHTELLWALERLAWLPDVFLQVVLAMASLSRFDQDIEAKPGRLGNRPFRSLTAVLHRGLPQSSTSVKERANALARVTHSEPGIGWSLALAQFGSGGLLMQHPTPQLRPWPAENKGRRESVEHIHEQQQEALNLLLGAVGTDEGRWVELFGIVTDVTLSFAERIVGALEVKKRELQDPENRVWAALRRTLHELGQWDDQAEEQPGWASLRERLTRLYEDLTPSSPVRRYAWLFSVSPDLLEAGARDYETVEALRAARRREVIEAWLAQPDGWDRLGELAAADPAAPWRIGEALAESNFANEAEAKLLAHSVAKNLEDVTFQFVAARQHKEGLEWGLASLNRVVQDGRTEDALRVALALPARAQTWDAVDAGGVSLREAYWRQARFAGNLEGGEWERLIENLLSVGRVHDAVEAADWGEEQVSTGTLLDVLERLRSELLKSAQLSAGGTKTYRIEELLGRLAQADELEDEQLARLEVALLPWVSHLAPSARLFSVLERDPKLFVDFVCSACRPKDASPSQSVLPEQEAKAEQAGEVLFHWRGYPGRTLPPEHRERAIQDWAEGALQMLRSAGRGDAGVHAVANVLARAPEAEDGMWPCLAARQLLEQNAYPGLSPSLSIAKRNLRGMTSRELGEGGAQERAIAAMFRANADRQRADYPRTAALLDDLATDYEEDAARQDQKVLEYQDELESSDPPVRAQRSQLAGGEPAAVTSSVRERVVAVRIANMRSIETLSLDLTPAPLTVLIGENGSGKSSILEACELLRRAANQDFLAEIDKIHGGLGGLLRQGASELRLGVTIEATHGDKSRLDYDVSLVRDTRGFTFRSLHQINQGREVIWRETPLSGAVPRPIPPAARARLQAALRGIEVHAPFEVTASWAHRALGRPTSELRESSMLRPAERLELLASNLANVYKRLQEQGQEHWEETLGYLRLGLGEQIESVATPTDPGGGKISLALKLRGSDQLVHAPFLSDGMLVYMAHVAWFRLPRTSKTLLCFDEPDLHLHPQLSSRIVDLFEAAAQDVPVIIASQSDRLLDALESPAESVVVCELDESRRTRTSRLDPEALTDWLNRYRGLGEVRAAGFLSAVLGSEGPEK